MEVVSARCWGREGMLERLAALTDGASALWMEGRSAPPGMLSMLVGARQGLQWSPWQQG